MSQGKMSDEEALRLVAEEVGERIGKIRRTEETISRVSRGRPEDVVYEAVFDAARRQAYALERVLDLAREQVAVSKKR